MKRLALLALSMSLVFLLFLWTQDAFSRGGGRGGFGGGGFGGGAPAYRGSAASRSPSMSSYSPSRTSVTQSRPRPSGNVAPRAQRPPTGGPAASQRPSPSKQKMSSAADSRVDNRLPGTGGPKPSQGQLQQFLNLPQQGGTGLSDLGKIGVGAAAGALGYAGARQLIESQRGGDVRPGVGDRGRGGDRVGPGDRPRASTLPAERPGAEGRAGIADRPGRPDRAAQLAARTHADLIRHNVHSRYDNVFTRGWWRDHPNLAHAYWHNFGRHPYPPYFWWRHAAWVSLGAWVVGTSWTSPVYYDYGTDIYYEGEQVYLNGQPFVSADEYYRQASDLASSAPPAQTPEAEWLPLGIFAISRDSATDSNMLLQLAVDKNGVIAGTYCNTTTDVTRPVRGRVDKKTQRAAWTFSDGKDTDIIMETGIFNLTQDQTEAFVHFGSNKTEQWLMVRLDQPKSNETAREEER